MFSENGKLDVLKWAALLDLRPPNLLEFRGGGHDATVLAEFDGYTKALEDIHLAACSLRPDQDGINLAAFYGKLEVLKWAFSLNPPLVPDQDGVRTAIENGYGDIIAQIFSKT
jgi:hypothetical protein